MEYQAAVAEIKRLEVQIEQGERQLDDAKYEQGRLIYDQLAVGITQRQLATDTGIPRQTLSARARTWELYGQLDGNRMKYADAYKRVINPGWFEGAPVDEPSSVTEYREQAKGAIRNMPPEHRAEVVREALAEPEVAEQVVRHTPTRTNLAKAEHTVDREQQQTSRERYELAEPRSVQIGAVADMEYALTKARQAFEDAAEAADTLAAHNWPDDTKERAEVLTQRALAAGELVRAKVEGRDLDEELAALLEGDA